MSKYYEMEYEMTQASKLIISPHRFHGYIEMEDEVHSYLDPNHGTLGIQYFKGININKKDWEKHPYLILGSFQTSEQLGESITFKKLVKSTKLYPQSCDFFLNQDGTSSLGSWSNEPYNNELMPAKLIGFKQLDEKQIGTKKVKNFLQKGYDKTAELPRHMKKAADEYEENKIKGHVIKEEIFRPKFTTVTASDAPQKHAIRKTQKNTRPLQYELEF